MESYFLKQIKFTASHRLSQKAETSGLPPFASGFSTGLEYVDVKQWISSISGNVICVVTNSLTHMPQAPEHVGKNDPILADPGPISL